MPRLYGCTWPTTREGGTSRGGVRKWRVLAGQLSAGLAPGDFVDVRARVRAAAGAILA